MLVITSSQIRSQIQSGRALRWLWYIFTMSKRPRPLQHGKTPSFPSADQDDLPTVPPLPVTLTLLMHTALPEKTTPRGLLSRLAEEDRVHLSSPHFQEQRDRAIQNLYESSLALEEARWLSASEVEAEACLSARRAAEAGVASCGGVGPGEELSRDAASAAAENSAIALREYGLLSASHNVVAGVMWGSGAPGEEGGDGRELPPPALAGDPTRMYSGRPLRGATSAVAYLGAEREAGFPPPRRDTWKYPLHASAASAALDPHLVSSAREMLKRPSWPDRLYPRPTTAGLGSMKGRALALAVHMDQAAAEEEEIVALQRRALSSLSRRM